jgi:uncharacterized membrane protein YccC
MMTGMTAAVVVLPSVLVPEQSVEITIGRVACTLIGVVVVTLVTGFFTPASQRDDFYRRVRDLAGDAVAFAAEAIATASAGAELKRRILAQISAVEAEAGLVSAGSFAAYRRLRHVNALIATSLAVMARARAVRARSRRGDRVPEQVTDDLAAFSDGLRAGVAAEPPRWNEAADGAGPELARLSEALRQLRAAEQALFAGDPDAHAPNRKSPYLAPHRDWALARRTGMVSGTVTFLAASAGYLSGWPVAELAALGVCIFSMVLGSMPMPAKVAPLLFGGVVVGVVLATLYRFALQPHLDSTPALLLSVLPFVLLGGLGRASRKFALPALDANMCFMLASQAGLPAAGAVEILSGGGALIAAAGVVSAGFWLLPPQPERHAKDAARLIRRDLERLLIRPSADWHRATGRQILRLMLHLGRAGSGSAPEGLLAALNFGHAVAALRELSARPPRGEPQRREAEAVLALLTGFAAAPDAVAARLAAQPIGDPAVARAAEAAADALREGRELFAFG